MFDENKKITPIPIAVSIVVRFFCAPLVLNQYVFLSSSPALPFGSDHL